MSNGNANQDRPAEPQTVDADNGETVPNPKHEEAIEEAREEIEDLHRAPANNPSTEPGSP